MLSHEGTLHGKDRALIQPICEIQCRLHRRNVSHNFRGVALLGATQFGKCDCFCP
jgi:hypothetical protein